MKKHITTLCFIVFAFTALLNQSFANDDVLDITVEPFFTALRSGDIEILKSYIGGTLYQNITAAFEQDKDYGAFLRQRYDYAIFYPTVIQQDGDKVVVSVNVDFLEKGTSVFELLVQKNSAGDWRIIDQYTSVRRIP